MSNSGKQSPLGINALSALLQNKGLGINPVAAALMGSSTSVSTYTSGTLITQTCLNKLTDAIRLAFNSSLDSGTYATLISIGSTTIPALGNACSSEYTYTASKVGPLGNQPAWGGANYTGEVASYGYVRLFAWQAYDEFDFNQTYSLTGQYIDFLASMNTAQSYVGNINSGIYAMSNSFNFLEGTYSNMNDLITSDITGVNLATLSFGTDLVNLGKAIDLSTISTFGLPSNLLMTLSTYNALTSAVSLAIIASGLQTSEVEAILKGTTRPLPAQELKLYQAFTIVLGQDLKDVLIPLNCKTKGLESLADLLNPIKLFPLSYESMTVPVYNTTDVPTNSKTYYLIYNNGGVNSQLTSPNIASQIGAVTPSGTPPIIEKVQQPTTLVDATNGTVTNTTLASPSTTTLENNLNTSLTIQTLPIGFGSYLAGILPNDIAVAAGAFSMAMQQIKNITSVNIEFFAQVVSNLETTKDLFINGTNVPVNKTEVAAAYDLVALGSGPRGTYTYSDFFGCMSGLPYNWTKIKNIINNIETKNLYTIYENLYNAVVGYGSDPITYLPIIQSYISQANSEIATIQQNNLSAATELNRLWNITGRQLTIEQRTRAQFLFPVPIPRDGSINKYPLPQITFIDSMMEIALDTNPHGIAQTVEAISDLCTGGECLVGMLRSVRNQNRLNKVGIPLDDNINDYLPDTENKELVANGTLPEYKTPTTTYPATNPADLKQADCQAGTLTGTVLQPQAFGFYDPATNTYQSTYRLNEPIVPGSFGDPDGSIIIPQLDAVYFSDSMLPSTLTTMEAIDDVIRCNCDCWDNL